MKRPADRWTKPAHPPHVAVRAGDFGPFKNLSHNTDRDIIEHGMETSSLESAIEIQFIIIVF